MLKGAAAIAVMTSTGSAVVADTEHHRVLLVSPAGEVSLLAGSGKPGLADGVGAQAQFKQPAGIAVDEARRVVYVADTANDAIRAVTYEGRVTTLVNSGLKQPLGLAVDSGGIIYVADSGNDGIKAVTPGGVVTAVAGGLHGGFADGPAAQALFKNPGGVAVSASGVVIVADSGNNRIRQIDRGVVSTIAGTGHGGFVDGAAAVAELKAPSGVAIDDAGNVYVADAANHAIRKIANGKVLTVAGTGNPGSNDGDPATAQFQQPGGISFAGSLFIADSGNDALRVIDPALRLTAIDPTAGPLAGGNTVRFFGTGFIPGAAAVTFGTVAAGAVAFVSSTEIAVTPPAEAAGTVDVSAIGRAGSDVLRAAYTFLPPPAITAVQPAKGKTAGREATAITGTNFVQPSVSIGGAAAAAVSILSPSRIVATTPPGLAGRADVIVTTPGGSTTLPGGFTYFAPPVIDGFSPAAGRAGDSVTITGANFDPDASGDVVTIGGVVAAVSSASATTLVVAVPQTASSGPIVVTTAGGTTTSVGSFTVVKYVSLAIAPSPVVLDPNRRQQLTLTATLAGGGTADVASLATWISANPSIATVAAGLVSAIAPGSTTLSATLAGLQASVAVTVRTPEPLPPDPSTVASKIDRTVVGMFVDEIKFLYAGPNPIQSGVAAGAIDDDRAAVVRGMLRTLDGEPLPAVKVTAPAHPELGQTLSRADGVFDFVINGGGTIALQFAKNTFIASQRSVTTRWGQQATIDDVVLIGYDAQVTEIALGAASEQVARASVISDTDGTRRATLIVPPATAAVLAFANGTTQPVSSLHIRATEYTVGPNGPKAMPAGLPPSAAYTYCVELSADEAVAAGAAEVKFSKPLPFYVENFLGFKVGTIVPVGYYDRKRAAWVPSDNGVVLKILSVTNGLAEIDLNGDGVAESSAALASAGIDTAERQTLASLYSAGQTLWRTAVTHFTPWDCNWPNKPFAVAPGDAVSPNQPSPYWTAPPSNQDASGEVCHASVINCYSATLSESIPIVGTPYSLDYESSRAARTQYSMTVSLSGAAVPASLKGIELSISIAGRQQNLSFSPQANQKYDFSWDGTDVYGRRVQGARASGVVITYVYDAVYVVPVPSGRAWDQVFFRPTDVPSRTELRYTQTFSVNLGHYGVDNAGFGSWSFAPQHFYDGRGGVVLDGGGAQRSGDPNQTGQLALRTVAGNMQFGFGGDGGPATAAAMDGPQYIAAGPDGALFIADTYQSGAYRRIRRVDPKSGMIDTIAGNGNVGSAADGLPALGNPIGVVQVAIAGDGSVYFTEGARVRRIVDGLLVTVAGNGTLSGNDPPNGSVATQVPIAARALAVGRDGSIYVGLSQSIYRVSQDGLLTNVASIALLGGGGLAVGPNDDLYATDNYAVYRIDRDGVTTIAGVECCGGGPFVQDGQLGTSGHLSSPQQVAVASDGTVLVSEVNKPPRVRAIAPNGIITTLVGTGRFSSWFEPQADGVYARAADSAPWGVAVDPDGGVYVADQDLNLIRKASGVFPPVRRGISVVPSADGSTADLFDNGRHMATVDTLTGTTLLTFGYDMNGLLTTVTDADGNVTTVERTSDGTPTAIVAPGGQRTRLVVSDGHLTQVIDPAEQTIALEYNAAGLLSVFHDARGGAHQFTYDPNGLVTRDDAPDGSSITLVRSGLGQNFTVTRTTAEGRVHTYKAELAGDTSGSREHDLPDGSSLKSSFAAASMTMQTSEGAVARSAQSPDPRFGMQSSFTSSSSLTAGGLTLRGTATLALTPDPANALAVSALQRTFSVNGNTWRTTYAGATHAEVVTSPMGRSRTVILDARGRPSSISLPGMAASSIAYNEIGRIAAVQQGSRTISFVYDERHQLASVSDPLSRTTRFGYDAAGRVTSQTLPDGRVIGFVYDANGNVIAVTPPSRPSHLFAFTAADLTSLYTPPSVSGSGATEYRYNRDRQLTAVRRPGGSSIQLGYDARARLSAASIGRGTYEYQYNTPSQLSSIAAPGGPTLSFGYNGPLLTSVVWSGLASVSYAYDANFRLASDTAGGSTIGYAYDLDGLLTGAGALTLQRNPQNGLTSGSALGTVTDAWTYDEFGAPASYAAIAGGNALFAQQYTRNAAGQIVQKSETVLGQAHTYDYDYDAAGRLSAARKDGAATTYGYDANGNRTSRLDASGAETGTVDAQDRLFTYGAATYTYAAGGELSTKTDAYGTATYSYDELGNLLEVKLGNGRDIVYTVDGMNRRVAKTVDGGSAQQWVYSDALRIAAELDGRGALLSRFVYATRSNVPDFMIRSGVTYRIIADQLGSPRLVVDVASGTVAQWLEYDELGRVLIDTHPGFQPFGFAGGLYDPDTGLVRFGARDYSPAEGRWTTKDPIGFAGGDANLYGYAFNDPVNLVDPSGKWIGVDEVVGALIGGAVNTGAYVAGQLIKYHGNIHCISGRDLAVTFGVGFVAGFFATDTFGASLAVAAAANTAQYAGIQAVHGREITAAGLASNAAAGALGGAASSGLRAAGANTIANIARGPDKYNLARNAIDSAVDAFPRNLASDFVSNADPDCGCK